MFASLANVPYVPVHRKPRLKFLDGFRKKKIFHQISHFYKIISSLWPPGLGVSHHGIRTLCGLELSNIMKCPMGCE